MTPTQSAVYGIVFALAISPWRRDTRLGAIDLVVVCRNTLLSALPIVAAVAAAGVATGVLNLTGMGLMLSSLILDVRGGRLWAEPRLTALASFVLRMAMPTQADYPPHRVLLAQELARTHRPQLLPHRYPLPL